MCELYVKNVSRTVVGIVELLTLKSVQKEVISVLNQFWWNVSIYNSNQYALTEVKWN